jgi:hypothetical protein
MANRENVGIQENTAARKAKARGGYHKVLLLRGGIKPVAEQKNTVQ